MSENILIPNTKEYNELNRTRSTLHLYDSLSIWPDWNPNEHFIMNSNEHWNLSDILDIVNPHDREFFSKKLTLEMAIATNTPKIFAKENNPESIYEHMRPILDNSDMELSRYAAWALVKEIGKNKPTEFFQMYFMGPVLQDGDSLVNVYKKSLTASRIRLRNEVRPLNKQLNGIFSSLNPDPQHYAAFHREKREQLFGKKKTKQKIIKQRKLLPNVQEPKPGTLASTQKVEFENYMNAQLLTAYIRALRLIIEKWDDHPRSHCYEYLRGQTLRAMDGINADFRRHNAPSAIGNLSQYGIKTIEFELKQKEIEFAKKYIKETIR